MIDWNPFEPEDEPPERTGASRKLEQVFHWLMLTALFCIVFAVSGAFLVMRMADVISHSQSDSNAMMIGIFIVGGLVGSVFLARICFGKWGK